MCRVFVCEVRGPLHLPVCSSMAFFPKLTYNRENMVCHVPSLLCWTCDETYKACVRACVCVHACMHACVWMHVMYSYAILTCMDDEKAL